MEPRASGKKGYLFRESKDGKWKRRYCEVSGWFLSLYNSSAARKEHLLAVVDLSAAEDIVLSSNSDGGIPTVQFEDNRKHVIVSGGYLLTIALPKSNTSFVLKSPVFEEAIFWLDLLCKTRDKTRGIGSAFSSAAPTPRASFDVQLQPSRLGSFCDKENFRRENDGNASHREHSGAHLTKKEKRHDNGRSGSIDHQQRRDNDVVDNRRNTLDVTAALLSSFISEDQEDHYRMNSVKSEGRDSLCSLGAILESVSEGAVTIQPSMYSHHHESVSHFESSDQTPAPLEHSPSQDMSWLVDICRSKSMSDNSVNVGLCPDAILHAPSAEESQSQPTVLVYSHSVSLSCKSVSLLRGTISRYCTKLSLSNSHESKAFGIVIPPLPVLSHNGDTSTSMKEVEDMTNFSTNSYQIKAESASRAVRSKANMSLWSSAAHGALKIFVAVQRLVLLK